VLLTGDRVLHNLALGRGFRSFVHTPETGLTDRRLAGIPRGTGCFPSRLILICSFAATLAICYPECRCRSERQQKRLGAGHPSLCRYRYRPG